MNISHHLLNDAPSEQRLLPHLKRHTLSVKVQAAYCMSPKSRQSRLGRFDAWVEIDGKRAQQIGDGLEGRTSSCFIFSKIAAEPSVHVQEYQTRTTARARADVYIEGQHVGKAILSPSKGPACFAGSWLNGSLLRPFVFTLADRNGSALIHGVNGSGTGKITVRISEVVLLSQEGEEEESNLPPRPLKEWNTPSVNEDDESIERHSIVLSESMLRKKYMPQHENFCSRPFDTFHPEPIAIFEFIYGPQEFIFRELRRLEAGASEENNASMNASDANIIETPIRYSHPDKHARSYEMPNGRLPQQQTKRSKLANKTKISECVPDHRPHPTVIRVHNQKNQVGTTPILAATPKGRSESVCEPRLQYTKRANIEVLEVEDSSDFSLSSISSRPNRPTLAVERKNVVETTFPLRAPSSAEQAQKADARQVLESIRLFSEQLMQAVAHNEEDWLLTDVVFDLVNKCDTSSRRLQASIMQRTRSRNSNSSQLREFD